MHKLIENFTTQIREAMEIGRKADLTPQHHDIRNVVVAGLGGSGIGGNLVNELVGSKMKIPMTICKDYLLPEFVNEHTLLICCSYSGNTEETLHALEQGINRMSKIVCITSGGSMERIARKAAIDCIIIPGGMPPRACLAYSFIQQLYVLFHYRLIDLGFEVGLDGAARLIDREEKKIQKLAMKVAKKMKKKIPVIYAAADNEAVAIRFRQQINENSKMLCWHHVIPEMNHNELVGWREKGKYAVIVLRSDMDYERIQQRMKIAKDIISQYTNTYIEINSKGDNEIEYSLYLIHLTDWISVYLADLREIDPVEVKVIERLKSELAG